MFVTLKSLRAQASKAVGKESDTVREQIRTLEGAIERSLSYVSPMAPLGEVKELEGQRGVILQQFEVEQGKVKNLEGDLQVLQKKVDKQEARHNELKKGKEDADRIADEIRTNQETLLLQTKRLESELDQSKAQLTAFSSNSALTADQKAGMAEIQATVEKLLVQLQALREVNEDTTGRFLALQTQYSDLEKEYRKLIDRELSGEE